MTTQTSNPWLSGMRGNLVAVVLIGIIATAVYSNSFDCSFHFDDTHAIVENYTIHRFDLNKILFNSNRPILDLTLAVNYHFGKLDVFGYHLVNLLLHISNGIMIYFILLWTARLPAVRPNYEDRSYRIALYASLIFVVHPVQTEAVTYLISRSEVLASSFYLLTILLFIKAFKGGGAGEAVGARASILYLAGAFLASCLGMGSKQIAATIPVTLLIYDFYFLSDGNLKTLGGHYKAHLAMFSTLAVVIYVSGADMQKFVAFDYAKEVPTPYGEPLTSWHYFLTQLHVIPYYIKLLFIPTNLNLDYDWPITRGIDAATVLFFLLLVAIVCFAIWVYRRSRLLSFSIIWFFVTLSVTSSFVVIYDVIFEHRLYLPSVGFALLLALVISSISRLRPGRTAAGRL